MNQIKITCPKCGETVTVSYHTTLGHALTDETLAINRAIERHQCKPSKPETIVVRIKEV